MTGDEPVWFGAVPPKWISVRLKHLLDGNDGGVWGNDPTGLNDVFVLRSTEQTVDGRWAINSPAVRDVSEADLDKYRLIAGDVVITKSSGSSLHIGKSSLVNKEMEKVGYCYSNFMQRIRPGELIMPEFLVYLLNNNLSREQFGFLSNTTTGLSNLNAEIIGNLLLPLPPLTEQRAIVAFLDAETARLDALLQRKQQLLDLLEEQRRATISQAVTRGLNPNAPMKDSGVEWLGEVPEGWGVMKLSYLARVGNGSTPARENPDYWRGGDYPWLNSSVVNRNRVTDAADYVTEMALRECHLPKLSAGTVLVGITGQGRTRGMSTVLEIEATINQHIAYISADRRKVWPYYLNLLLTRLYGHLRFLSDGGGSTKGALTCEQLAELKVCVPPMNEQQAIAAYLDAETAKLDALRLKLERSMEQLREYRSALITAAVTGQIDVRSA